LPFSVLRQGLFDIDRVIWVVDFERAHRPLPTPLSECLGAEGAQTLTVELLSSLQPRNDGRSPQEESSFHDVIRSLEQFDGLGRESDFLLFFDPPSMDDRIVNQFALFSVMPNAGMPVDDWLKSRKGLHKRVILPRTLKRN
jgi:hypothetical protein